MLPILPSLDNHKKYEIHHRNKEFQKSSLEYGVFIFHSFPSLIWKQKEKHETILLSFCGNDIVRKDLKNTGLWKFLTF